MTTTRLLLTAFLVAMMVAPVMAQITAPFAVGVRGNPDGGGLNLRYFFNENLAIEGQGNLSVGTINGSGKSLTGVALVEYHILIGRDPRWRIFLGGGAHYGSWERYKDISPSQDYFGLDAIGGVEYVFESLPVGISLDAKPSFNFVSGYTLFPNNTFGLGLRFYFGAWEEYDSHIEDKRE